MATGGKTVMQDREKHTFWQELCVFLIPSLGVLSVCIQNVQVNRMTLCCRTAERHAMRKYNSKQNVSLMESSTSEGLYNVWSTSLKSIKCFI